MVAMFLVAIETTIVSEAMPRIVAQMGDTHLGHWATLSFLLAQMATTVIFGKVGDQYGRKPVILVGIGILVTASALAGLAWSMPAMIAFRSAQGVGAGAIQPAAMAIVADLYPPCERCRIQGYLASIWATSVVLGPLAGGFIIGHGAWPWIFWIGPPIGIVPTIGLTAFLRETAAPEGRPVDFAGATLFMVAVASLTIAVAETGESGRLRGPAAGLFCASLLLFIAWEARAPDPMISFALWRHRTMAAVNGATLLTGMALAGLIAFLPAYGREVQHQSPIVAALVLTTVIAGWSAGATVATQVFRRCGMRRLIIAGSILVLAGATILALLAPERPPGAAGFGAFVMGTGMGLSSVSSLALIQGTVGWPRHCSATASNLFARNLGNTLGAAVLGAVIDAGLKPTHPWWLQAAPWALLGISLAAVLFALLVPREADELPTA